MKRSLKQAGLLLLQEKRMNKIILQHLGDNTHKKIIETTNDLIYEFAYQTDVNMQEHLSSEIFFLCSQIVLIENSDINYKKESQELFQEMLSKLRELVYSKETSHLLSLGMFDGLGNLSFALHSFYSKNNTLKNFDDHFYSLFKKSIPGYLDYLLERKMSSHHYDVIYGVSGLLNYTLDRCDNETSSQLMAYLLYCSSEKTYKDYKMLNYHIENEQIQDLSDKDFFFDGYLDLGLSHGMIGPGISIAKYFNKQKYDEKSLSALKGISSIYKSSMITTEKYIKFPTRLSPVSVGNNIQASYSQNESWCYGNISIIRSLMKISKYTKNHTDYLFFMEELAKVCNIPFEEYRLDSPILCHGLAGIISIQMSVYEETGDIRFLSSLKRNVDILLDLHEALSNTKNSDYCSWGFLTGRGGVLLTLSYLLSGVSNYTKILMCD